MDETPISHKLEFTVDKALIAAATRRFWLQFVGWGGLIRWGAVVLGIGVLSLFDHHEWPRVFDAAFFVFIPAIWATGYVTSLRRSFARLDRLQEKQMTYTFTEDGVAVKSDLGKGETQWRAIDRVQRYPDVWLLYYGAKTYVYLPAPKLDEATKAFIIAQASRNGAKVT